MRFAMLQMLKCQFLVAMCDHDYGSQSTPNDSPACTNLIHTYWKKHFPRRPIIPIDVRGEDAQEFSEVTGKELNDSNLVKWTTAADVASHIHALIQKNMAQVPASSPNVHAPTKAPLGSKDCGVGFGFEGVQDDRYEQQSLGFDQQEQNFRPALPTKKAATNTPFLWQRSPRRHQYRDGR